MSRNEKKARRLTADGTTYLWSLSHTHHTPGGGRYADCREILTIRQEGARGRLRVVFRDAPGRLVPDGYLMPSGAVGTGTTTGTGTGTESGGTINLHEPGTTRALLEAALAQGWHPDAPTTTDLDGWTLFDAVALHRGTPWPPHD